MSGQTINRNVVGRILDRLAGGKTQSDVISILPPVGILVGGGDGDIRNNRILKIHLNQAVVRCIVYTARVACGISKIDTEINRFPNQVDLADFVVILPSKQRLPFSSTLNSYGSLTLIGYHFHIQQRCRYFSMFRLECVSDSLNPS